VVKLTENKDPEFWREIACHPEVAPYLDMGRADIGSIALLPGVIPMATEHGGFLVCPLDASKCVWELHALYTPDGWGREVHRAGFEMMLFLFGRGAHVVIVTEIEHNWRSKPPRSFGYTPCGEFVFSPVLGRRVRTWSLSSLDWLSSPAFRRGIRKCHLLQ
jgi:hypothetical protein